MSSVYSPLPQSNSDSDGSSEEELHVPQENRVVNRISKMQNSKTDKPYNGQKQNIINYKPLDTDGDIGVKLIKFQSNADEVSILKPNNSIEMFSTSRKICFVLSLLLCICTTIVFIWILPCNVGSCLSASNSKDVIKSWEEALPGLEIYGPISIVLDSSGRNQNLVFLIRSPIGATENNFLSESGLISLKGISGAMSWKIRLNKQPTDIDCRLIDVNLDGFNDCLIVGNNLLKAINSKSGEELWDINNSTAKDLQPNLLDFPLVIPDIDGDEVKDLLTSCSFPNLDKETNSALSFQNYFVIISGKTGTIINNPYLIKLCSAIHNLMLENSSVVSYTCYNTTEKESMQTINLIDVYKTLKNTTLKERLNLNKSEILRQHQGHPTTIHVNGHRLILENLGHCPEECNVLVDMKDERDNKTIYSYKDKNAYGMVPVILKSGDKNYFILKFWKWQPKKEKDPLKIRADFSNTRTVPVKNNTRKKFKKRNEFRMSDTLANEMLLESESGFPRHKRTADPEPVKKIEEQESSSNDMNLRVISETVMAIPFNSTYPIVNVTKDEIIQICKKPQICQPDVSHQKHSILSADLNDDGKEELISFTSKYIHDVEDTSKVNNETWKLQSKVRVITF